MGIYTHAQRPGSSFRDAAVMWREALEELEEQRISIFFSSYLDHGNGD